MVTDVLLCWLPLKTDPLVRDQWNSTTDWTAAVQRVRERAITGRNFLLEECDGKLLPQMFTEEGCAFANKYYERIYTKDYYDTLVVGLASGYMVADSWDNYERIAKVIEQRYAIAKARRWWKFW